MPQQRCSPAENPYAIDFPDPYAAKNLPFYGKGLAVGGRLMFGYPYLPVLLLLVIPAYLAGDIRYAHIAAILIAAVLMHRIATDTIGRLAATLFLFTPWIFKLEELGWTDAFTVLFVTGTVYMLVVYCKERHGRSVYCSRPSSTTSLRLRQFPGDGGSVQF